MVGRPAILSLELLVKLNKAAMKIDSRKPENWFRQRKLGREHTKLGGRWESGAQWCDGSELTRKEERRGERGGGRVLNIGILAPARWWTHSAPITATILPFTSIHYYCGA